MQYQWPPTSLAGLSKKVRWNRKVDEPIARIVAILTQFEINRRRWLIKHKSTVRKGIQPSTEHEFKAHIVRYLCYDTSAPLKLGFQLPPGELRGSSLVEKHVMMTNVPLQVVSYASRRRSNNYLIWKHLAVSKRVDASVDVAAEFCVLIEARRRKAKLESLKLVLR